MNESDDLLERGHTIKYLQSKNTKPQSATLYVFLALILATFVVMLCWSFTSGYFSSSIPPLSNDLLPNTPLSKFPTYSPSVQPTDSPTKRPSQTPTTRSPTDSPTKRPTQAPTTHQPTDGPHTTSPSPSPTVMPSDAPTPFPTLVPTLAPI